MANSFRSRLPSRSRSSPRKTSWTAGPRTNSGGISITGTGKNIAQIGALAAADGDTIVRLRGDLLLFLKTASAAATGFDGAFGIGIVTDQAFNAGVASIPGPLTDFDWNGWFYHQFFHVFSADAIVAAAASSEPGQLHSVSAAIQTAVDSKAMRKIPENNIVVAMIETTEVGVATMQFLFNCRILVKLP